MTPAAFSIAFEEFTDTSPNIIQSRLDFAAARMGGPDFSIWPAFAPPGALPSLSDMAHGYLAAHYLATSPYGSALRTDAANGKGRTPYLDAYEDLELSVAGGFLVAGVQDSLRPVASPSGSLILTAGAGSVALVNGSTALTFQFPQTLPAGTVLAFPGTQNGALYALAFNMTGSVSGTLTAIYTGVSNPGAAWSAGGL